jgi:hypothetical protein
LSLENKESLGCYTNRAHEDKAEINLFLILLNRDIYRFIVVKTKSMFIIDFETNSIAQKHGSQYCVAQTISEFHSDFGNISGFYLSAADSAGGERVAIRLSPCDFKRL